MSWEVARFAKLLKEIGVSVGEPFHLSSSTSVSTCKLIAPVVGTRKSRLVVPPGYDAEFGIRVDNWLSTKRTLAFQ